MKMKKMTIAAILVLVVFTAGQVYAGSASESDYGSQSQMEQGATMGQSQSMLKASEWMGKTVNDQQGQEIGTVEDLVIGQQGQVEYVILSPTGDLAQQDQLIPLPWQVIQPQTGQEALSASVEMDKLKDAPSISADQLQELSSQDMQSRVQGYYGVESQQGMDMQQRDQMMQQDHMMKQDQMMKQDHMQQKGMERQGSDAYGE